MSFTGFGRFLEQLRVAWLKRPSDRALAFALAVVLPLFSAAITAHFEVLHGVPFALHFVCSTIVASLGGFLPALLSIAIAAVANHYLVPGLQSSGSILLLRVCILVVAAATVSLMTRGLRRAAADLSVALAALREQTSALIESQQASKCASWTYRSTDKTRWYPGGYPVFGIPFAELEKLASPIDLIWPEDQVRVREATKEMIATRGPMILEYRVLWPNGELHWSEARGTPIDGHPTLWRGVTFDITERKLSEAALIRSEKLAAMGRLASTIAHEINNPLEAVTNLLYLARGDASLDASTDAHLATAERELARVGEITRLALGFIRTSAERRELNIIDGIEDVIALFRHRFEMKNIHVDRRYQPGVRIHIAPHELRQIFTNLISNAIDALSTHNGRISIGIERIDSTALLQIQDNGSGISEAHLDRVFEPFFSTKDDTGTGIGLWVTRELVEKNGGRISVQSGHLPGDFRTSFRIEFPACAPARLPAAVEMGAGAVS